MDQRSYSFMAEERRPSTRRRKILYLVGVVVVGAAFGTLLFWLINGQSFKGHGDDKPVGPSSCPSKIDDTERFNCHPDQPVTEASCYKRGCCFRAASDLSIGDMDLIDSSYLGVPSCFFPSEYKGYKVVNVTSNTDSITADLKRNIPSGFMNDVLNVHVEVTSFSTSSLRIRITDSENERFEPDVPLHIRAIGTKKLYDAHLDENGTLTIRREDDKAILLETDLTKLVFSDQFLQLSTPLASHYLYGLGEQKEGLLKSFNWTRYSIFNQGDLPVPHRNLYGTHPFYLLLEPSGKANGLFLRNSNAMDFVLQPTPALTMRSIGGILDIFLMLGPSPSDVVEQYTGLVGRPFMIPYWSLGFQICKYGYFSLNKTQEVLQRNLDAGVPIDVQWHDIDFMDRHLDFTYDPVNFAGLPEWVDGIHGKGMHYVAMISPGVSNSEDPNSYPPFDEGKELDLFVKDHKGDYIQAKVWNDNYTVFPDFSNPFTPDYWAKQFERYHKELDFDGVWIDMNEPLNFLNGSDHSCPDSSLENPAYVPGRPYPLRTLTICMTAKHNKTLHYNEHNLVAFREAHATYDAMKKIRQKRPFIISRASFAGQGAVSGHWSGDITSDWEDMRYTIPSMLAFNMYGMPMIGSDICGFRLNTTEELCARWQALGSFYPFSRNHNDFDTFEQDPVAFGTDSPVLKSTLANLKVRYYFLPYFYTLFHRSHAYGETPVRPLFFEFPEDSNVYNIDDQFLWGPGLMVMPALYANITEINPYIPKCIWYDYNSGLKTISGGARLKLQLDQYLISLFIRGGTVFPLQQGANTTVYSRQNAFDLLVALDAQKEASGNLYWDDGDSLDTYENGVYNEISFTATNNTFRTFVTKSGYATTMNLNSVIVYGLDSRPMNLTIDEKPATFTFDKNNLIVNATGYSLLKNMTITWE